MGDLKLEHVYKFYDEGVPAVRDFDLHIKDKEFIVLVGPSGCGKSTTLRMIAGLEDISKGDLLFDGKRMNDVPPKNRDIAMVFQNYALYSHMTVFNNMAFGLKLRKVPKAEIKKRVEETAAVLGLENFLHKKPEVLSGGQRQRVALGRAIVRDAKYFLMDEPLSNLDATLRSQMRSEIIKLHQRLQTTTIYVTHDQTEAMTMATRIVVMKDGVIQQVGTPKEVYNSPKNLFVGGFIGSPAMNFLNGSIQDHQFKIGEEKIPLPVHNLDHLKEKGFENKEVILGIRPEHIHLHAERHNGTQWAKLEAYVEVVELLGSETLLYLKMEDQTFIARVEVNYHIQIGERISLAIDLENAHFFDSDSEERI